MTNNEEYINLIKDWIRPRKKALTLESENKFTILLGKKLYFNDYLNKSLSNLDNLKLINEFIKLFSELSKISAKAIMKQIPVNVHNPG